MPHASVQPIYLKDYTPSDFLVDTIHLTFQIFETYTQVTNVSMYRKINVEAKDLFLYGEDLLLHSVYLNTETPSYTREANGLWIYDVPQSFTLTTIVSIDPAANKQLMGLYKSDGIFCTQNEPEGFRCITYHLDRPDIMSMYTTKIIAEKNKYPILLSNGNCIDSGDLEDGNHFVQWSDPFKKPCYLFAMVAGDLFCTESSFTTCSGKNVTLKIYTDHGNENRVEHALESLKKAMKWDEEHFGREYDLDIFMIVAVDAFNAGAMENKGLNIFNAAAILCDPLTATDADYKYIEAVVAHEYFHNWTGNRITCRDWFQLTLKEGLTVFRDAEFSADMDDRDVKRLEDVSYFKEHQFAEDSGPMAHPIKPSSFIEIENFYTMTIYEKGSEVIRMLQTMYGKENFRKAMDLYFETFDGQAVTTEDFIWSFEKALEVDLTQFKNSWYSQAGTPVLKISDQYNAEKKEYILQIIQSCPHPKKTNIVPYHFPFSVGLFTKNGVEIANQTHIITKEKESITFTNIDSQPIPSLLRNFSAPVKLEYNYSFEDNLLLFAFDTDVYCKYEAFQRLMTDTITDIKEKKIQTIPENIIHAVHAVMDNPNYSDAMKAELLVLPGLYSLVSRYEIYEYEAFFQAKKIVLRQLANALDALLLHHYTIRANTSYEKNNKAMGERAFKNWCLSMLSYCDHPYNDLLQTQFDSADNMTDSIRSLALLSKNGGKQAQKALASFAERWKDNALVMNKWFAVQASAERDDIIDILQRLEKHRAFDKTNPNKIRSLFGIFGRNYPFFHAVDGRGYVYIADKILEIDRFNQKASSSLAQSFRQYSKLDDKRKQTMKISLEKIINTPNISPALYEVVSAIVR